MACNKALSSLLKDKLFIALNISLLSFEVKTSHDKYFIAPESQQVSHKEDDKNLFEHLENRNNIPERLFNKHQEVRRMHRFQEAFVSFCNSAEKRRYQLSTPSHNNQDAISAFYYPSLPLVSLF